MCGIYGFWSPRFGLPTLLEMGRLLEHRGPDDASIYRDAATPFFLGHQRLAILDLTRAARQPMSSPEGRFVLSYNGEVYNYRELRRELEGRGCRFRSSSDSEVVLNALVAWGERALLKMHGMFALALWDRERRELFLARDATGMKPLFYSRLGGKGFAFASELKALSAVLAGDWKLNEHSIRRYLQFGYVWGEETLVEGIRKLLPGQFLRVTEAGDSLRLGRWWSLPPADPSPPEGNGEEWVGRLHELLREVCRQQLRSDVPVAVLLSGGLDSSLLTALLAREEGCDRVQVLTAGFEPCPEDERPFARKVARHLGVEQQEIVLRPGAILSHLREAAWYYDDLFWDTGFLSSLFLYRRCRELGFKVVLLGEGADEVFGGYRNFSLFSTPYLRHLPDPLLEYLLYRQCTGHQFGPDRVPFRRLIASLREKERDWFSTLRRYELEHQIPNNLNMKVDRASMANGVEARLPFQDRRVLELATRLPVSLLLREGTNKWILRELARRYALLPEEIAQRPKFGMLMPGSWLQSPEMAEYAREVILRREGWATRLGWRRPMRLFFRGEERRWTRFFRRHLAFSTLAWRLLILETWLDTYSPAALRARCRSGTQHPSAVPA